MTLLFTTLTALSIAMLSIGCVRTSHQLSEVAETVTDDEIVGIWEEQDSVFGPRESDHFVIQQHKNGCYRQHALDRRDESEGVFKLMKVDDVTYMECNLAEWLAVRGAEPSEREVQSPADLPINLFPCRWERRGEWIAIWLPDRAVLRRLLQEEKLTGRVEGGLIIDDINVTSSAEELAACLQKHSDEIYGVNEPPTRQRRLYRRVSAKVPAPTSETTSTP
ncbi:hypothetical protein [Lacipirellula sp.]|uniref:hypothetical protein n=1 Tax=Lacipirellula sp. TaxID=2691419 RepID=UPI003D140CAB